MNLPIEIKEKEKEEQTMRKKQNKGFTLIELLAVIVILAIIMLIAGPIILDLIDNSQKGAFKNTAYGIIEAGKYNYTNEIIQSSDIKAMSFSYVNGVETSNPSGRKLDYKGDRPKTGAVLLNAEGQIAIAIHNGKYCASKNYMDVEATISKITENECLAMLTTDSSGASAPVLSTNMIPIVWNGTKWIKASASNLAGAHQWYDYSAKNWANVALVRETERESYKSAALGTEVLEGHIMAYLVWIPRYKYMLFNTLSDVTNSQQITVTFENKTVPKSAGSTNGTYLTHPAFTFGTTELSGIWVGKFETTGSGVAPTIKPNVPAIISQTAKDQFDTAKGFNATSMYGLTAANDSHMMKNTEWGAVAYLSQSIYGKNSEIWNNSNNNFITGCAGTSVSASPNQFCQAYTTDNGQQASTTGNVSGIYDMSGGAHERTMGVMYNSGNTTLMISSSGFTQVAIDDANMVKYIDKYTYGTTCNDLTAYNRKKLGDATGEVYGWNEDYSRFVCSNTLRSWFTRGHVSTNGTPEIEGPFSSNFDTGAGVLNNNTSFRVVVISD